MKYLIYFFIIFFQAFSLFAEEITTGTKIDWGKAETGPGPVIITPRFPIEIMLWTVFLGGIFFILSFRFYKIRNILRILCGVICLGWIVFYFIFIQII